MSTCSLYQFIKGTWNNERIQAKIKWMAPVQYRLASMS
ncbi:IS3 family transposase [Catenibacterium mitsuokai]